MLTNISAATCSLITPVNLGVFSTAPFVFLWTFVPTDGVVFLAVALVFPGAFFVRADGVLGSHFTQSFVAGLVSSFKWTVWHLVGNLLPTGASTQESGHRTVRLPLSR